MNHMTSGHSVETQAGKWSFFTKKTRLCDFDGYLSWCDKVKLVFDEIVFQIKTLSSLDSLNPLLSERAFSCQS